MSNSDKARLKRITAAVLADQPPAPDDFAWLEAKRAESPGLLLATKLALKQGGDSIRTLLHPDTLTGAKVETDGRIVISHYPDDRPSQTAREIGYDSLETAHTLWRGNNERADRSRANASKPRPSSRHPRRKEAENLGVKMASRNPKMSVRRIGELVMHAMDGDPDSIPPADTIARWLRLRLK